VSDLTTEDGITAEVIARLEATPSPRLREVMQAAVKHLHAFAKEVRLTNDEWFTGIQFLTATGQMCDDVRQEFILLSDTLGFSTLLDIINNAHPEDSVTESTILGPFYVPNSPWREYGESMVEFECGGVPSILRGRVLDMEGNPIPGAVLDVWQNASNMFYAVQQPDVQPPTNLRGRYRTDAEGRFDVRGVQPTDYPVPADGPVGQLLHTTGRHEWRAAHVHVKVSADGYTPVSTHVFDRTSQYMDSDTVFGVKESLFGDFVPGIVDDYVVCDFDFVLAPAG